MDVFWIVVVILLVAGAFGYAAYLYVREAGPESARLWLTGSRLFRIAPGGGKPSPPDAGAQVAESLPASERGEYVPQIAAQDRRLALDGEAIRSLKEEFQRDLRDAVGRSREFDARLTRIEAVSTSDPELPREIARVRETQRVEIERLRISLDAVGQRTGAYGERRGQVLTNLYSSLARLESAMRDVVNPTLLPGEMLTLPGELPSEALQMATWGDVVDLALSFGNVFSENRLILDPSTADDIAAFIVTLRSAMTGSVQPAIRNNRPSADQVVKMRAGLQEIVVALPVIRRTIETAYRAG